MARDLWPRLLVRPWLSWRSDTIFFCLQAVNRLPGFLLERLRRNRDFQAARYEIAVAAIMVRAGLEVKFLDEDESNMKHCDLIASNSKRAIRFGVEAKSRVRPGALHSRGEFQYEGEPRGLLRLLRGACQQSVDGLPLVVFVDVNVTPTPLATGTEKQWVRDMMDAVEDLDRRTDVKGEGDPYSLIVATNFGFHFGSVDGVQAPTEFGLFQARHPAVTIGEEWFQRIGWSVARYGRVPAEL
jgi:hypothetical protein